MSRLTSAGGQTRRVAAWALAIGAALLFTQVLLPGASGGGRGTPTAILFEGAVFGLINGLVAAGLVLIYRTIRVINFAQTAIGSLGAAVLFQMVALTGIPFPIALAVGLLLATVAGIAFELVVVRAFFNASRLVLTVATIAAASLFTVVGGYVVALLPFIPLESAGLFDFLGAEQLHDRLPLAGFSFTIGALQQPFRFAHVFAIEAALISLILLGAFLRYTRIGVAVRALAENPERSSLLGVSVGTVSLTVWAVAGSLSGMGAILTGMVQTPAAARGFAPGVLLPALAAAVIARFERLPTAVVAAVMISVVAESVRFSSSEDVSLVTLGLFVAIAGGLLIQRRRRGRSEEGAGVTWQAVEEQRPIPKELSSVPGVRTARIALVAVGVLVVLAYPFLFSTGAVVLGGNVALTTIVVLSLVVLTGWAGQVSLGQYGFVAVGAVVGGALSSRAGVPFWLAVPLAATVSGAVAVLVGIPALRLKGLFLAITTFAFGMATAGVLFNRRYFGWLLPGDVQRPTLFFLDFEDEQSMYYLCVAALILAVVVVTNLRRSRFGRVLIAMRENEPNLQALGIPLVRTKLVAFAVSGALAGFAGAIFAHQQRGLNAASFAASTSVDVFLYAVVGGVSSVGGALLGSAYYNFANYFVPGTPIYALLFQAAAPALVLLLMFVSPGGMIGLVNRLRDAALRIVAQRRQIVVPSLFADYDAEALERRLIPLAEPSDLDGLAALGGNAQFALPSELYQGAGVRFMDRLGPAKQSREAAAIGAATERAMDELAAANGDPND